MMLFARATILALFILAATTSAATAKTYKLYFLGGQSNMVGYGYNRELPDGLNQTVADVMIFHGNTARDGEPVNGRGVWATLRSGHGAGFQFNGKDNSYSDRFGPELTFAQQLKKLDPGANIAIIKYSRGGTSIDSAAAGIFGCWDPDFTAGSGSGKGVNQYDHFLATIRNALAVRDLDGDGEDDTLVPAGIVWMQGESDGRFTAEIAQRYEANLKRLMDLIRAALRQDDVPVAVGRISDSMKDGKKVWQHGAIIRAAQAAFVEKDDYAALITTTDEYGYSDPYHYDTKGYLDLGRRFADAIAKLNRSPSPARDVSR